MTSHVVRQASGFLDHVRNRGFVSETLSPFIEVRLHLLEKFLISENIDAAERQDLRRGDGCLESDAGSVAGSAHPCMQADSRRDRRD